MTQIEPRNIILYILYILSYKCKTAVITTINLLDCVLNARDDSLYYFL